jgi:hypothetical protein
MTLPHFRISPGYWALGFGHSSRCQAGEPANKTGAKYEEEFTMTAGPWTFPTDVKMNILNRTINLTTGVKAALFNSSWTPGANYSTTNELSTQYGYTQGGAPVSLSITEASGTATVTFSANPAWTANGGSITARRAAVYDSGSSKIICYCLLDNTPADVTVTSGNILTVAASAAGIFTMA